MLGDLDALRRGELAGAHALALRCGLVEFPREIFGLADTLEVLDLSGNALDQLPHDLGRLRALKVLFCSGNRFEVLPPGLGDCAALSQVGFRATGMREVPAESLPPRLRWLTLTDNAIETLPDAIGDRPLLQKLMLAGNRLRSLPEQLAGAKRLELLRLSANQLEALPGWLTSLPRLAWLAWAGNPVEGPAARAAGRAIDWATLRIEGMLGEGASGRVMHAVWAGGGSAPVPVAVKLFKGAMTSDGAPEAEMRACLEAGAHPALAGALGQVVGHPDGQRGLVMNVLPADWRPIAAPPSLASCSRDVYEPDWRVSAHAALRVARCVAEAGAHLHARGLSHGDLYGHNVLWDGARGEAVLTDFGAASFLPSGTQDRALRSLDVRAWGVLVGELLDRCKEPSAGLRELQSLCVSPGTLGRPEFGEIVSVLSGIVA
jgi:hypothetical protein